MECFELSIGSEIVLRVRVWSNGEVFIEDLHGEKYGTHMSELYEMMARLQKAVEFMNEPNLAAGAI